MNYCGAQKHPVGFERSGMKLDGAKRGARTTPCRTDHFILVKRLQIPSVSFNSTVQQECIPQSILGQDVLCQAKSGMGKTAVFVLAVLQQLEPVDGEVSTVILCHTRELAFQIKNEFNRFTKYMPDVRTAVFYGGTPVKADQELLADKTKCPHIVVGTPGRMNGLTRDKSLDGSKVKMFVLDECDKMLEQLGELTRVVELIGPTN